MSPDPRATTERRGSPRSAPAGRGRAARGALLVGAGGALLLAGACFAGADGLVPPTNSLYFPTGIAVSPGRSTLYVANSDFDLQYNGGTVQALQLGDVGGEPGMRSLVSALVDRIAAGDDQITVCAAIGSTPNVNAILHPGPCQPVDVEPFVRSHATIGAFATAAVLLPRGDEPGLRLFVPVRGDPSVTYFDVVDDRDPAAPVSPCGGPFCLECDGVGLELRCGSDHRIGEDPYASQRGLTMPVEPSGIAAVARPGGDALVVAHQTSGAASLIVNRWPGAAPGPSLEFTLSALPDGPNGVVALPVPGYVDAAGATASYRPAFVVSHRAASALTVVRYEDDARSQPARPFLTGAESLSVTLTNESDDGRGLAIDASERQACEATCDADELACLRDCLDVPLRVYVAGRSPAALLVGTIESDVAERDGVVTGISERISLDEVVPLPIGASQITVGHVVGRTGELETRVFTVSFDSRFVLAYDPLLRRVDAFVRTGRGPFGLALDTGIDGAGRLRSFLWVGHFTDSYLGVVDLDTRNATYGTIVASFGPPVPPRDEQ